MGYSAAHLLQIWFVRTVSVVAGRATERGLQSAGVLVSEGRVGILRARLCVLTFLRDESRAPAAILVGALNTYLAGRSFCHESSRDAGKMSAAR